MQMNPRFKITIEMDAEQEEWRDVMTQELRKRLDVRHLDYFILEEESDGDGLVLIFSPRRYMTEQEFLTSFEENVMKPARKAAGLE